MACRLFGAKTFSEPTLKDLLWNGALGRKVSEIRNKIRNFFFYKNAYENIICEMAEICGILGKCCIYSNDQR